MDWQVTTWVDMIPISAIQFSPQHKSRCNGKVCSPSHYSERIAEKPSSTVQTAPKLTVVDLLTAMTEGIVRTNPSQIVQMGS